MKNLITPIALVLLATPSLASATPVSGIVCNEGDIAISVSSFPTKTPSGWGPLNYGVSSVLRGDRPNSKGVLDYFIAVGALSADELQYRQTYDPVTKTYPTYGYFSFSESRGADAPSLEDGQVLVLHSNRKYTPVTVRIQGSGLRLQIGEANWFFESCRRY